MKRINKCLMILGRRGSGKTVFVKSKIIPLYQKFHKDKRILIIDTFDHPDYKKIKIIQPDQIKTFKNIARCFNSDTDLIFEKIDSDLRNSLVIFEDSSKYVNKSLQKNIRRFILDSKQKNLDLIFLFHGFSFAPPELFRITDGLIMFKTDNPEYRKQDLINFEQIRDQYIKVMESENPYIYTQVKIY